MEIKETSTYLGPSVYSPYPVLRLALAGLPRRLKPREISGLANRLAALLPELEACWTSCTAQHAPTDEETAASGPIGHFFEHVCIELQNLVGTELRCVRNAGSFRKSAMDVIVPFEEKSVGMAAARLASDLVATAISERDAPDASSEEREQVERRLEEFVKFGVERLLPVQDRALIRTARALDVPVTRLAGRTIQLGHGCF
ncbi:MAG: hypothetical protein HKP27_04870, partial [Myxococcales bacterium]|nr:hypothetical protein [Myxococcales bacterium]